VTVLQKSLIIFLISGFQNKHRGACNERRFPFKNGGNISRAWTLGSKISNMFQTPPPRLNHPLPHSSLSLRHFRTLKPSLSLHPQRYPLHAPPKRRRMGLRLLPPHRPMRLRIRAILRFPPPPSPLPFLPLPNTPLHSLRFPHQQPRLRSRRSLLLQTLPNPIEGPPNCAKGYSLVLLQPRLCLLFLHVNLLFLPPLYPFLPSVFDFSWDRRYSETFYALLCFGGMYHFVRGGNNLAVIFFALSGCARSNGVLNAGYICFQTMHRSFHALFHQKRLPVGSFPPFSHKSVCFNFLHLSLSDNCTISIGQALVPWIFLMKIQYNLRHRKHVLCIVRNVEALSLDELNGFCFPLYGRCLERNEFCYGYSCL